MGEGVGCGFGLFPKRREVFYPLDALMFGLVYHHHSSAAIPASIRTAYCKSRSSIAVRLRPSASAKEEAVVSKALPTEYVVFPQLCLSSTYIQ